MSESKILKGLNFEQRSAAAVINGPVCTNAGPGSGKTRTLTHSIAYRIEQGAEPDSIVAITFTNKAKEEIKNRIKSLLGEQISRKVFVGTYHGFLSANVLMPNKRHPAIVAAGYKDGFVIADSDDADKILDEAIKEMPALMMTLFDTAELKSRDVKDFMSKQRAAGYFAHDYIEQFGKAETAAKLAYVKIKPNLQILASSSGSEYDIGVIRDAIAKEPKLLEFCKMSAWRSYENRMKTLNAIDYDGMLVLSKYLLESDPALRGALATEIKHILLDEFQDTNNVQWDCMKLIIDAMDQKNVLVVGDPDQCIYQFRSANPQIMREFDIVFPSAQMKYLTTNYRSTSQNVQLSNVVKGFINPSNLDHPMTAFNKEGELPDYHFFDDEKAEAEFVVGKIKGCISEGVSKDKIAVLYRGKAQRRAVEAMLTENHIPYQVVGDISFYETKEVKDTIAMLRMISNESDILGFTRGISVSSIPVKGLTMRHEIEKAKGDGKELSPMQYLYERFTPKKITAAAKEKMNFWITLKELINTRKNMSESDYIFHWMKVGYEEVQSPLAETLTVEQAMDIFLTAKEQGLLSEQFDADMKESREAFFGQVIDRLKSFHDTYYLPKLQSYSESNDMRVPEQQEARFQERLDNVQQVFSTLHAKLMESGDFEQSINDLMLLTEQADEQNMDGVQLMTIHASKGLEFDTVFLIGTEQRSYFTQSQIDRDYEAEACAFFVATSRAERKNVLTGAKGRVINGSFDNNSDELIFIKGLPNHVVNRATAPVASSDNSEVHYYSEINNYNMKTQQGNAEVAKLPNGRIDLKTMVRGLS